jgi:SAM-dependent methyltransferase
MTNVHSNHAVCLASCFLQLDAANGRWWKQFQEELAQQGVDLVLLSSAPAEDPDLRVIVVPFWLHGLARSYHAPAAPVVLETPLVTALAARDDAWALPEQRDPAKSMAGLSVCQHLMRQLLEELQPAAVLVWGNSLPQSVILQQLAIQQGRPCWVIERGLLPGTLMIEMSGQGGQSELNLSFALNRALQNTQETGLFLFAQAAYRRRRESKYSQVEFLDAATFRQQHNPSGRKLVALLLQHDVSSCIVPRDYLGARLHAPAFASSEEAMLHLASIAQELDCTVLAKPHPVDCADYSHCENEHLRVVRDVNLFSLIEAADVVAAMNSTAQFEALLCEKPLLLLAHSQLAGKGVAYEVGCPTGLRDALASALNRDGFEHRLVRARQVLSFILRNYAVALTDSSPAQATLGELAAFVARNALPIAHTLSLETRFENVQDLFRRMEVKADGPSQVAPAAISSPPLEILPVTNRAAFESLYQSRLGELLRSQQRFTPTTQKPFTLPGYCAACRGEREFMTDFLYASPDASGQLRPSWRERQVCQCGLNSRQRACFHVLTERLALAEGALVYCTEQQGALFQRIRQRFPFTLGSEFLGNSVPLGQTDMRGIRNEDLTRLTYPDDAFDCIVSLEVLEHIPDYPAALAELARCLKPGGRLLLTTPIHFNKNTTVVRASFGPDGKLTHHLPPVYHGDPINSGGALCFNDFGWDLLVAVQRAGFADAALHFFTSEAWGYLGLHCLVLATRDPVLATRSPRRTRPQVPATAKRTRVRATPSVESTEILQQRADELRRGDHWREAGEVYQQLSTRLPDDLAVWRRRLECARQQSHAVMADLILEEALERHPEWAADFDDAAIHN